VRWGGGGNVVGGWIGGQIWDTGERGRLKGSEGYF